MWETGNCTSRRDDDRVHIEKTATGWWVYNCDPNGHILTESTDPLVFAPPACPEPFLDVGDAQVWANTNIPPHVA